MRSRFEFSGLKKEYVVEAGNGDDIFFRMLDFVKDNLIFVTDDPSEIFDLIPDGRYWIAQNMVSRKGKKRLFSGSGLVCAFRHDIVEFIKWLIESGDLRNVIESCF